MPTATEGDFLGNGSARGQVHLLVGGRADRFIYSVMAGTTLRGQRDFESVSHGHEFVWGAGLGALVTIGIGGGRDRGRVRFVPLVLWLSPRRGSTRRPWPRGRGPR